MGSEPDGRHPKGRSPLVARDYMHLLDAPNVEAYILNTTGVGFQSVAPDPNTREQYENGTATLPACPVSSTLNWTAGKTVANLVPRCSPGCRRPR